jgi:histone-lysine N-methyltransferase ASH1L
MKTSNSNSNQRPNNEAIRIPSLYTPQKPLTSPQKQFVQIHHCFLVRNYEKVRIFRETIQYHLMSGSKNADSSSMLESHGKTRKPEPELVNPEEMIQTGLTALTTARSVQTRRLAIVQDDPKVTKVVKLAQILREIFFHISSLRFENSSNCSRYFKELPNRKSKDSAYYETIQEPIDLNTIERNINTGTYLDPDQFDKDLLRLFQNNLRYYGHYSDEGQAVLYLRKNYVGRRPEYLPGLEELLGPELSITSGFRYKKPEPEKTKNEDIICCPCGQYKDEGVMIQCEKCQIWQHVDCVGKPTSEDTAYYCAKCSKVDFSLDIQLVPQPEYASPGETYYVSLMRENLQVRMGDTVYVLRAFKSPPSAESPKSPETETSFNQGGIKHKMMSPLKGPSQEASTLAKGNYPTYKSVDDSEASIEDMDIFRVERLWINEKGERFAFGHHYLRPHETFHEPSRKFFRNEVFRVPIYEVLPLDTIWRQCWVLDLPTFCKGRPRGALEEHIYICEYRVDKTARLFHRISKPKVPVCTKWFAFDIFDLRLKPSRNYTPHEVPEKWKSEKKNNNKNSSEEDASSSSLKKNKKQVKPSLKINSREKLDTTLARLLARLPNNQEPLDATHLLEGKRMRKKASQTGRSENL